LNLPDGSTIEFQADKAPTLEFQAATRSVWLLGKTASYDGDYPIMEWISGAILIVEENAK
jgi:hypothetical protein